MDFERIFLLLNVVHSTIDVPHTNNIRQAALQELADWNSWNAENSDQPELPILERKL